MEPEKLPRMNAPPSTDRAAYARGLAQPAGTERMVDKQRARRETATSVTLGNGRSELSGPTGPGPWSAPT